MTKTERPLGILTRDQIVVSILVNVRDIKTYTLPASVVGGARRSGFCLTMDGFVGPITVAPREPRIA